MKELIWKRFVKDYENIKDPKVRASYTRLTGTIGIITNSVLCVIKIVLGLMINSIAVIADGAHDLADSLAAVITLIGAKLANKPADKDHPFGHARIEYLCSLVVAAIVLIVGFELMKTSIGKCIHPTETAFSWFMVGFMGFAIVAKGSSALFTIATGKHINSLPVIGAGRDNRNDVLASIVIVIGMLVHHFTGIELDGYMGCLVSLFILYSGFELIKDTVQPLIGEAGDEETADRITEIAESYPEIIGIHDMIIYNYGPGKEFASFHAEFDSRSNVIDIHDIIDNIEVEVYRELKIPTCVHMDPVDVDNPIRIRMTQVFTDAIKDIDGVESFHDLRIVPGKSHTNIIFDAVISQKSLNDKDRIREELARIAKQENESYEVVVNFDTPFV